MTELVADSFNRANAANLGANWGVQSGGSAITISGNQATSTASPAVEYYSATAAPNDGYAEIVVGTAVETVSDTGIGPAYRMATAAQTMYFAQTNTHETRLYKVVNGSFTQLGTDAAACSSGQTLRITCNGTAISVAINGSTVIGPVTDSGIASGRAGIWSYKDASTPQADSFAFGDLNSGGTETGTGAITLGAVVVSGSGTVDAGEITGTGAITLGHVTVAGTAEREVTDVGGSVDILLPAIVVSGSQGTSTETGTGAIALGAVTVSGTAEREIPGAGAITLGALRVSAQGLLVIDGDGAITLGAIQVDGFDVAPVTELPSGGGFYFAYQHELERRRRERKRRQELEEESERIEEETTREIARLLREQEARDARRNELQRLSQLVDTYARGVSEAALSERVQKAISVAAAKQTTWALFQLEREMRRAAEEEEFILRAMQAFIDHG